MTQLNGEITKQLIGRENALMSIFTEAIQLSIWKKNCTCDKGEAC